MMTKHHPPDGEFIFCETEAEQSRNGHRSVETIKFQFLGDFFEDMTVP